MARIAILIGTTGGRDQAQVPQPTELDRVLYLANTCRPLSGTGIMLCKWHPALPFHSSMRSFLIRMSPATTVCRFVSWWAGQAPAWRTECCIYHGTASNDHIDTNKTSSNSLKLIGILASDDIGRVFPFRAVSKSSPVVALPRLGTGNHYVRYVPRLELGRAWPFVCSRLQLASCHGYIAWALSSSSKLCFNFAIV